jgi:hypothetical protein
VECIAAQSGVRGARKTVPGWFALSVTSVFCSFGSVKCPPMQEAGGSRA